MSQTALLLLLLGLLFVARRVRRHIIVVSVGKAVFRVHLDILGKSLQHVMRYNMVTPFSKLLLVLNFLSML